MEQAIVNEVLSEQNLRALFNQGEYRIGDHISNEALKAVQVAVLPILWDLLVSTNDIQLRDKLITLIPLSEGSLFFSNTLGSIYRSHVAGTTPDINAMKRKAAHELVKKIVSDLNESITEDLKMGSTNLDHVTENYVLRNISITTENVPKVYRNVLPHQFYERIGDNPVDDLLELTLKSSLDKGIRNTSEILERYLSARGSSLNNADFYTLHEAILNSPELRIYEPFVFNENLNNARERWHAYFSERATGQVLKAMYPTQLAQVPTTATTPGLYAPLPPLTQPTMRSPASLPLRQTTPYPQTRRTLSST